ncbi:transport and Golgi organization protein 1-like [Euwallacea fornicatus]|uniref:transport and Golgi organization protein 1-like n=1 Tax=Euwallacea fornicatus TaxID=995702 RepID=UPI00338F451B
MFSFKSVYFVIFILIIHFSRSEISDKRLCVDEKCSGLISVGKTLKKYNSIEEGILSFGPDEEVKIFSYGAGTRPEFLGVEIAGKRGYVNKDFISETHRAQRPKVLVNTELSEKEQAPLNSENKISEIKADTTLKAFEIVDGTKIPLDIASLSTELPPSDGDVLKEFQDTKPLDAVSDSPLVENPDVSSKESIENFTQPIPTEDQSDEEEEGEDDNGDDTEDDSDDETDFELNESPEHKVKTVIQGAASDSIKEANTPSQILHDVLENAVSNMTESDEADQKNEGLVVGATEKTLPVSEGEQNNKYEDATRNNTDVTPPNIDKITTTLPEKKIDNNELSLEAETKEIALELKTESIVSEAVTETKTISTNSEEKNTKTLSVASDNVGLQNEEGNRRNEDGKQYVASEENNNNVVPTTQVPIEIEVLAQEVEAVTQDPAATISAEPLLSNPHNSPAENYVQVNNVETPKNEEPKDEGIFGGIGNILPLFNFVPKQEETAESASEINAPLIDNSSHLPLEDNRAEIVNFIENRAEDNNVEGKNSIRDYLGTEKMENVDLSNERVADEVVNPPEEIGITKETSVDPNDIHQEQSASLAGGFFSEILSLFGFSNEISEQVKPSFKEDIKHDVEIQKSHHVNDDIHIDHPLSNLHQKSHDVQTCDSKLEQCPQIAKQGFCDKDGDDCPQGEVVSIPKQHKLLRSISTESFEEVFVEAVSSDLFLYLTTTSFSVLVLIFVWILVDKCRREGPLIARINKLEQQLLATLKENDALHEKTTLFVEEKTQLVVETVPNEVVNELNDKLSKIVEEKLALEDQILALEKELDNSTEVGIELNKIISEMLNSGDGSEILKDNIEQMQKRLLEQQDTINSLNDTLNIRETESYEIKLELDIARKKVGDLQREVDMMVEKILKIEEEKDRQHGSLENEIAMYKNKCKEALTQEHVLRNNIISLNQKVADLQRLSDTKIKEYDSLKETLNTVKSVKNDKNALKSFLDVSEVKAQLEQMKSENLKYSQQISKEREANASYTTQFQNLTQEIEELRLKYEKADKDKVESTTKLEVLNNYFKEKEAQMRKEINKYESLWATKEGEATSTTERIRYMQEELQNYKSQNENLKQEIINQEVELKSQISMLEKKNQENWVIQRQAERKLEEARHEAAILRNRLTLRERTLAEGNNSIRMQSPPPHHQNGELPVSPNPTQSPPLLFNPRDHITKSPPLKVMPPPPFLPPPLAGTPFMPPPPLDRMMSPLNDISGMPPFLPGLAPGMFPGDHRPPPLGRMSSPPPVGGRYSPESTVYSEYDRYDRRTPSPPYDSEYGVSPPPIRGYSPYNDRDRLREDRRDYKRPQPRSNGRNSKGVHSSGSENDSLGRASKKPQRKV